MITKTVLFTLSLLLFALVSCRNKPTDKNVASTLKKHFANSVKITELLCTYKKEPEIQGTKFYSTTFNADIEFTKDCGQSEDGLTSFDPKFNKGDKYKINSGSILFISTPNDEWFGNPQLTDLKKIN